MILTATFWSDNSDFLHTQSSPFARDSAGQITGVRMMEAQRERGEALHLLHSNSLPVSVCPATREAITCHQVN